MTTHELAKLLLQNPDCTIKMQSFDGGNDSFVNEDITHVTIVDNTIFVSPCKYEDYYGDVQDINCIYEPAPQPVKPLRVRQRK